MNKLLWMILFTISALLSISYMDAKPIIFNNCSATFKRDLLYDSTHITLFFCDSNQSNVAMDIHIANRATSLTLVSIDNSDNYDLLSYFNNIKSLNIKNVDKNKCTLSKLFLPMSNCNNLWFLYFENCTIDSLPYELSLFEHIQIISLHLINNLTFDKNIILPELSRVNISNGLFEPTYSRGNDEDIIDDCRENSRHFIRNIDSSVNNIDNITVPKNINQFESLYYVNLHNISIRDSTDLSELSNIKHISISNHGVGYIPKSIMALKSLEFLWMNYSSEQIKSQIKHIPCFLTMMTNLRSIDLGMHPVEDICKELSESSIDIYCPMKTVKKSQIINQPKTTK